MRTSHLIPYILLLSSTFGLSLCAAQNTKSYGTAGMEGLSQAPEVHIQLPAGMGCPVSLRAQHGPSASLQQADQSRPKGLGQLLRLTLVDPNSRLIVRARVQVHGLSGKARATQTLADSAVPDAVRSLEVRFTAGEGKAAVADVWVPAMSAVLRIDLNSVTYADGTTRTFSASDNCRVAPDSLMLVSSR